MGGTFRAIVAGAATLALTGFLASGCALDRAGVGGGSRDAGPRAVDAATRDASPDVIEVDAGPCDARCDGDRAIVCTPSGPQLDACGARGELCVMGDEGPRCTPRICEPASTWCEDDVLHRCDDRGATETTQTCPSGCSQGVCRATSCVWITEDVQIADEGEHEIDLCGKGNDQGLGASVCESAEGNGDDAVIPLLVQSRARLRIDLRDTDSAAIDTIVAVRNGCDDMSSSLHCNDDIGCDDADEDLRGVSCESGRQPRQSRIEAWFEPGLYYVVLDTDVRGMYRCGRVRLRVRAIER